MIKMRGLTLLCLVGFILTASWPKGDTVPLANTGTSQRQTRQIGTAARIPETDGEVKKNDSSPTKPKTDGEVIEVLGPDPVRQLGTPDVDSGSRNRGAEEPQVADPWASG
ncbi:uncharacterized protein PEZ65_016821 isoform 4-T4 [Lycodopsis pacificus]